MTAGTQPADPAPDHTETAGRRHHGTYSALRHNDFRALFGGQLVSLIGDQLFLVAMPFLLASGHPHDATRLATVLVCLGVARAVAVLAGGAAADRMRRWRVMMGADLVRLSLTALLAALTITGLPPLLVICGLAVGLGLAEGAFLPSSYAIVPDLVPGDTVLSANALVSAQTTTAMLVGPLVAGLVVAGTGPAVALAVDAATFALSAGSLALIRGRHRRPESAESAPDTGQRAGYRQFLGYFRGQRLLWFCTVNTLVVNLGYSGMMAVALPILVQAHHRAATSYGLLLAASGAGALTGAMLGKRILDRPRSAIVGLVAGIAEGVLVLSIPAVSNSVPMIAVPLLLAGAGTAISDVFFVTALQQRTEPRFLGRTMSVLMLAAFVSGPASYALMGALVATGGFTVAFLVAGTSSIVAFGLGFLSADIRGVDLSTKPAGSG